MDFVRASLATAAQNAEITSWSTLSATTRFAGPLTTSHATVTTHHGSVHMDSPSFPGSSGIYRSQQRIALSPSQNLSTEAPTLSLGRRDSNSSSSSLSRSYMVVRNGTSACEPAPTLSIIASATSQPLSDATPGVIYRKKGTSEADAVAFGDSLKTKGVDQISVLTPSKGPIWGWHGNFNASVADTLQKDSMVWTVIFDSQSFEAQDPQPNPQPHNGSTSQGVKKRNPTVPDANLQPIMPVISHPCNPNGGYPEDKMLNRPKLSRPSHMSPNHPMYQDYVHPQVGSDQVEIIFVGTGLNANLPIVDSYRQWNNDPSRVIWLENSLTYEPRLPIDANVLTNHHGSCVWMHAVSPEWGSCPTSRSVIIRDDLPTLDALGAGRTGFNAHIMGVRLATERIMARGGGPNNIVVITSTYESGRPELDGVINEAYDTLAGTGALLVVCAGNNGAAIDDDGNLLPLEESWVRPWLVRLHRNFGSNVLIVGSTDVDDRPSPTTAFEPDPAAGGPNVIEIWAMATQVECPRAYDAGDPYWMYLTNTVGGTSYAAPQIAGIAANQMAMPNPPSSTAELKRRLISLAWPRRNEPLAPPIGYNGIFGVNQGVCLAGAGTLARRSGTNSTIDFSQCSLNVSVNSNASKPGGTTFSGSITHFTAATISFPADSITTSPSMVVQPSSTRRQPPNVASTENCRVHHDSSEADYMLSDCRPTDLPNLEKGWLTCEYLDHSIVGDYYVYGGNWSSDSFGMNGKNLVGPLENLMSLNESKVGISQVVPSGDSKEFEIFVSAYGYFEGVNFNQTLVDTMRQVAGQYGYDGPADCKRLN